MIQVKSVNFRSHKTGLLTCGYTLFSHDGTIKQPRSTAGVLELPGTGIYFAQIDFGLGAKVILVWDSGETPPLYAAEDVDYQMTSEGMPMSGATSIVVDNTLSRAEAEFILKNVQNISDAIKDLSIIAKTLVKGVQDIRSDIVMLKDDISVKNKDLKSEHELLGNALLKIMEAIQVSMMEKEVEGLEKIVR